MQFGSKIKWIENNIPDGKNVRNDVMSEDKCIKARDFHKTFPQYRETPLAKLNCRAENLGLGGFYVKDESYRFGLNAFKVLGCSYAVGQIMAERFGIEGDVSYESLRSKLADENLTLYTATDGNHGRAVAWTARVFGQKARVYMPAGTKTERFENVKKENAVVTVENFNYDRCVERAREECEASGGILVQDTAWEGYEYIPTLIMQGYGTMAAEAAEQMPSKPTHIFLQAGVGSMAAAVTGYFSNMPDPPVITIVEPDKADCVFQSAKAGERVNVDGDLDTIMAGLACGEVSTVAWDILHACADFFVSVPDEITEIGMRLLAKPVNGDDAVISGESGAVCAGFVETVMTDETLSPLREKLNLNKNSVVLCFSTEGATDRENWEKIVNT